MVKTDDIIDSVNKLINTNRIWVRYFNDDDMIKNAPKHSFYHRLSKKKALVLRGNWRQFDELLNSISSTFFFDNVNTVLFNIASLASYARLAGLVGFLNLGNYDETLAVFYMRKNLDETRKQFIFER